MIIRAVSIIFDIVEYMIFIRVILSWFVRDANHPLIGMLGVFVDPIIEPVRWAQRRLGLDTGFIDFTPLFAVFFLRLIRVAILQLLIAAGV